LARHWLQAASRRLATIITIHYFGKGSVKRLSKILKISKG